MFKYHYAFVPAPQTTVEEEAREQLMANATLVWERGGTFVLGEQNYRLPPEGHISISLMQEEGGNLTFGYVWGRPDGGWRKIRGLFGREISA